MCQKQCRDENGFKCHQTSEGHLRQMKIFRENASEISDMFSNEVRAGEMCKMSFLDTMTICMHQFNDRSHDSMHSYVNIVLKSVYHGSNGLSFLVFYQTLLAS